MKTLLRWLLTPLVIACSAQAAFAARAMFVLQLEDPTSREVRTSAHPLEALGLPSAPDNTLRPVFRPPSDPEHLDAWYRFGLDRWYVLETPERNVDDIPALAGKRGVVSVARQVPDMEADTHPNDFDTYDLWHLAQIHCPSAWNQVRPQHAVIVAVIDAGCRVDHPDLAANMAVNAGEDLDGDGRFTSADVNGIDDDENGYIDDVLGWDFVSINRESLQIGFSPGYPVEGEDYAPADAEVAPDILGHGTHVTGIAAAVTDNGIGVASAGWNLSALPLRAACAVEDPEGNRRGIGYAVDFAAAIQYACDRGARVINISYTRRDPSPSMQAAMQYAENLGCLIVAAAGNSNISSPHYPAWYPEAISVAALDRDDVKADFSNFGDWIDISAPGVGIWSTITGETGSEGQYAAWDGTSMASPLVAAVGGVLFSMVPQFTVDEVRGLLLNSAINIDSDNPGYVGVLGAGCVDLEAAVEAVLGATFAPTTLVPHVDDLTGQVFLYWQLTSHATGQDGDCSFIVTCDGVPIGETTETSFTHRLSSLGYHEYRVISVHEGSEIESQPAGVFWLGAEGAVPVVTGLDIDPQFGTVSLNWSRGQVGGMHRVQEVGVDTDEPDTGYLFGREWRGQYLDPGGPCRLLQLRLYTSAGENARIDVTINPWEGDHPGEEALASMTFDLPAGQGWHLIDCYQESVALPGEVVISIRPHNSEPLILGHRHSSDSGKAWMFNDGSWSSQDGSYLVRAVVAVQDERVTSGNADPGDNLAGKWHAPTQPWCAYSIWRDGVLVGSTEDSLFQDQLPLAGDYTYSIKADFATGSQTRSGYRTVTWDRGTEWFQAVDPTGVASRIVVTECAINEALPQGPVEIGVFDGNLCVGAIRLPAGEHEPCTIAAWRGGATPGYTSGHPITFRIWDSVTDQEKQVAVWYYSDDRTFGSQEVRVRLDGYQPRPPGSFSIVTPETGQTRFPGEARSVFVEWSRSNDPDPFAAVRYELMVRIHTGRTDTTVIIPTGGMTSATVDPIQLAGPDEWTDTVRVHLWVDGISDADRTPSSNSIVLNFAPNAGPDASGLPDHFALDPPFPNPFNACTSLRFRMIENGPVQLAVFDLLGRCLLSQTLTLQQGIRTVPLDATEWGSGVYFVRANWRQKSVTRKLLVLK